MLDSGTIDSTFRAGFWAKTLQRFFVLEQFMKLNRIPKAAHAELDVVLLAAEGSLPKLDKRGKGIFIPWFPGKYAIGSFVYINDVVGLSRLVERALTPSYPNEMELLKQFLIESPDCAFGLPTADQLISPNPAPLTANSPPNLLTTEEAGGVFDAARLGQWVFGLDSRNVQGTISWNHSIDQSPDHGSPGGRTRMIGVRSDGQLQIARERKSTTVLTLHIHAKTMVRATNPTLRSAYIRLSNLKVRVPIRVKWRRWNPVVLFDGSPLARILRARIVKRR